MGIIWIFVGLVFIGRKRYRKVGWRIFLTLILGVLLVEGVIKPIVARPRPFTDLQDFILLIKAPISYSFPSGHTTSSFGAATTISFNLRKSKIPAYTLATLIAFSRMYLYVHYPTDILIGCFIGVFSAWIIHYFMEQRKK